MNKNNTIFLLIQLFFTIIFIFLIKMEIQDDNLQPFNSKDHTVNINFKDEINIDSLITIANENKLNISIYDNEKELYYTHFNESENPIRIFGVDSENFLSTKFNKDMCASTNGDLCEIKLSSSNKQQLIYPLEKLDKSFVINSIKLYPQKGTTPESTKNIFLNTYPNTTFLTISNFTNPTFMFFCIIFLFLNCIIICSMLQEMFKKGKISGLKKLFGVSFFKRFVTLVVPKIMYIFIIFMLLNCFINNLVTFDYSYTKYIYIYTILSLLIILISFIYVGLKINNTKINLLIKGKVGSKLIMRILMFLYIVILITTSALIPKFSSNVRILQGEIESFKYYEENLVNSGVVLLSEAGSIKLLEENEELIDKNEQLVSKLAKFLEFKKLSQVRFSHLEDEYFPVFKIDINIVNKYFNNGDLKQDYDKNTIYIFVKNQQLHEQEIKDLKLNLSKNEISSTKVIEYGDLQIKEFIQNEVQLDNSQIKYSEINDPIYIYDPNVDNFDDFSFSSHNNEGYYFNLESDEAKIIWDSVPEFLEEFNLSDDYIQITTLAQMQEKFIDGFWNLIYLNIGIFFLSMVGIILLINACIKEYFVMKRRDLVLKKLFGMNFNKRYLNLFAGISIVYISCYIISTIQIKEYSAISLGLFVLIYFVIFANLIRQIKKLEKEAINIVIKE
ncbi:MAG: hypothetical protein ACRC5R_01915 [Mycoplasmatales bacterium]